MIRVVPLDLDEANAMVAAHHRHHEPVRGHRWSIGVVDDAGVLHGAAIAGRPLARLLPDRAVLEVSRVVTDGTPNACSMLYAACARAGRAQGYEVAHTYILDEETGVSVLAAGWEPAYTTRVRGQWVHGGQPRRDDGPEAAKQLWFKRLNPPQPVELVVPVAADAPPSLFDDPQPVRRAVDSAPL